VSIQPAPTTSLSLAITYFGLVVALGTLLGCRWFARIERRRAGIVPFCRAGSC